MRIVFVGSVDFSRHCLQEVVRRGGQVVAVLNPEPQHARANSDYADLAPIAASLGIPLVRLRRITDPETADTLRTLAPDVMLVLGFSQIVPKDVLAIPRLGCIGSHPALLPRNRGRHPLVWALVEGLSESGLTFFFLDEGVDSGDILWQKPFPITLDDDAGTLYEKIKRLAGEAIGVILPRLEAGTAPRRPQDHSQATYWRKRTAADGEIDWVRPPLAAYNLIRALTKPYPGAHTFLDGQRVLVWRSRMAPDAPSPGAAPGEIVGGTPDGFMVQCGGGLLELRDWECDSVAPHVGAKLGAAGR